MYVTYRGAFGTDNWTAGWAQFNPEDYTVIGISQISSIVPDKFILEQNYPNPFNPSTVIRYSLTERGFTSLKIYNALGKEVATLVNQKQDVGTYEATFNGANLSSGVYFYTLRTKDFSETKRMTLIK